MDNSNYYFHATEFALSSVLAPDILDFFSL